MPRASFSFGTPTRHTMEVNYTWWGREEYYVDGRLLNRRWNASLSGTRQFDIGGHSIRIQVVQGQTQYFTRVFVDDALHVEELFPKVKARFEKWKGSQHRTILVLAAIIATLIVISLSGVLRP